MDGYISTAHLSIESVDSANVHSRVRRLKILCRNRPSRLAHSEAATGAVGCPAVESTTTAICLTGEGEGTGCTIVGGREVKRGWRGVGSIDGHLEHR